MNKPTEHQPLDDFFRRKLKDTSVPPSAETWNQLQEKMQQAGQRPIMPLASNRSRRSIGYWSASTAAACILAIFLWTIREKLTERAHVADRNQSAQVKPRNINRLEATELPIIINQNLERRHATTTQSKKEILTLNDNTIANAKSGVYDRVETTELTENSEEKTDKRVEKGAVPQYDKTPVQVETTDLDLRIVTLNKTKPVMQVEPERTLIVSVSEPVITPESVTHSDDLEQSTPSMPSKNARINKVLNRLKLLKEGEVMARANLSIEESDDESGLFNRLVRSTRSKDHQDKREK